MQNLEQIRAAHALSAENAAHFDKKVVNKLPALIVNSGLLAATAFTFDTSRAEMNRVMTAVAQHLAQQGLIAATSRTAQSLVDDLSGRDSAHLQRATAESLAYLSYLKRFASKDTE